ncbi:MAG: hypothetical protein JKZ00_02755 [Flavobacteriaceae bacterium]|nr:hypothetical protein [Flavobacteriaceae bacterium]
MRRALQSKFYLPKKNKGIYIWLIVIAVIALVSQAMPFIIDGKFSVLDRYNSEVYWAKEVPLFPSVQWLTQTLYFITGLLVVFIISSSYTTVKDVKKAIKLLLLGITFMIFWGWLGDLTYFLGISHPNIFNQIGMNEFGIHVYNGFPRMVGTTMEASYFAQMLIPMTPYFYWFHQQEKDIVLSKRFNRNMYILSIITLPIAITTTGVFGFFLVTGFWLKNNLRFFSKRSKYFLVTIYLVIILISIFFAVNYLVNISGTYSGIERFKTVVFGAAYFLNYPILGLGWGVFPTYDFLINLLVNFGIIGTIPFLILMYNVFIRLRNKIKDKKNEHYPLFIAALESFVLIIIVSQLSGFIYHSQYFWLYIGIVISIGGLSLKKETL